MGAGNPLWDVHDALWTMLEAQSDFATLVAERNRIKYVETAWDAVKHRETVSEDAVPEVAVIQAGMGPSDRFGSNVSGLLLHWKVLVTTGDHRFDRFFDVQFAVFRALLDWDEHLKGTLTWEGRSYVGDCDLVETKDDLDDEKLNRGIRGWSSVWAGNTHCYFNHTTLIS